MSLAGLTLPGADRSSRWLLIASLALNLFFIGAGSAFLLQSNSSSPASEAAKDHSIAARMQRIAARLPDADAGMLVAAYRSNGGELDRLWDSYRKSQGGIRAALRAEPFQVDALRSAMAKLRAARQDYDLRMQDFFASLAAKMSPAGRQKLADWPNRYRQTRKPAKEPKP